MNDKPTDCIGLFTHRDATFGGAVPEPGIKTARIESGRVVYPEGLYEELVQKGDEDVTTTYETAFPEFRFNDEEPGNDNLFHRAEFWDRQELDVENRHFEIEYAVGTPSDDTLIESEQQVVIAYYPPADGSVRVFALTGDADFSPTDCAALIFEPTICASFIDDEGRDWHINFYSDGYWEFNGRSDSTTGDAWAILERETASE